MNFNRHGFTLIEVILAITIGTLAIVSMGPLLSNGMRTGAENRLHLYALNALREEIENLRDTNYDTLVGYGSTSSFSNAQLLKIPGAVGTRTLANSLGSDIKKLTLTVTWTTHFGASQSQSLSTRFTRIGLNRS